MKNASNVLASALAILTPVVIVVAIVIIGIVAAPAFAQQDPCAGADRIFRPLEPGSGLWHLASNWSGGAVPLSTEVVCVPPDRTAYVVEAVCSGGSADGTRGCTGPANCPGGVCQTVPSALIANAAAVLLPAPSTKPYGIRVETNASRELRLSGRDELGAAVLSKVDRFLYVGWESKVVIESSLTVQGDGGVFEGEYLGPVSPRPTIVGPGTLTIQGPVAGQYDFRCSHDNAPCHPEPEDPCAPSGRCKGSIMITESWIIEAPLVNEGQVVAVADENGIELKGPGTKSGGGLWRAIDSPVHDGGGFLAVNCPITVPDPSMWQVGPDGVATFKWRTGTPGVIRLESGGSFLNLTATPTVQGGRVELRSGFFDDAGLNLVSGSLFVNVPVVSLIDLRVSGGTMLINDTFDTDGDLIMTGGKITVATGKQAFFD